MAPKPFHLSLMFTVFLGNQVSVLAVDLIQLPSRDANGFPSLPYAIGQSVTVQGVIRHYKGLT
jgi:hypothetical protein